MKYVALVGRKGIDTSDTGSGAWSAFMGDNKEEVVERALRHRENSSSRGRYEYTVFVGTLTEQAAIRPSYVLVALG